MVTKERFCDYINYMHFLSSLVDKDRKQKHILSIMKYLHGFFPRCENGFSDIEHYCFFIDFGKDGVSYESPEELYERLTI